MRVWTPALLLAGCSVYFGDVNPPPKPDARRSTPVDGPSTIDAPFVSDAACPLPVPTSDEAPLELDHIAQLASVFLVAHGEYPQSFGAILPGAAGGACPEPFEPILWSPYPAWRDLGFSIGIPNRYSYTYSPLSTTAAQVLAIGDLDCDGWFATYTLALDGNGKGVISRPSPYVR
jgi:hypothetical protein